MIHRRDAGDTEKIRGEAASVIPSAARDLKPEAGEMTFEASGGYDPMLV
jgi:hypothetical protein